MKIAFMMKRGAAPTNTQYRNRDLNSISKCTLCDFTSNFKNTFQRHLMKFHGIKLRHLEQGVTGPDAELGRVRNDYNLSVEKKFGSTTTEENVCGRCKEVFKTKKQLNLHRDDCKAIFNTMKKGEPIWSCPQCNKKFLKSTGLFKHSTRCGQTKDIACVICSYTCFTMDKMERHFIDVHNLICQSVEEADFEQALNEAPYTLSRAIVVDVLPDQQTARDLLGDVEFRTSNKRTSWPCVRCNMEFSKQKDLNKHRKLAGCGRRIAEPSQ